MRKKRDSYPSEPVMVDYLLDKKIVSGKVLEPCAGAGHIASPLRAAGLEVVTNDIDAQFDCDYHYDVMEEGLWDKTGPIDWVVTNPPYTSKTLEFVLAKSFEVARDGVAMILRLTANEPVAKRSGRGLLLKYWADHMRYLITFSAPRPSFTGDGKTDTVTTAWFVWDKRFSWKKLGLKPPFQYVIYWR